MRAGFESVWRRIIVSMGRRRTRRVREDERCGAKKEVHGVALHKVGVEV